MAKIPPMSLFKHPRSPFYWVDIQPAQGSRVRKSTGETDRKQAQKFHDELKASLWKPKQSITWSKAVEKWLDAGERSTSELYMLNTILDLDIDRIEEALEGKKPATYNRYRSLILAVLNLSKITVDIPKRKVPKSRQKFLTVEEWERLHKELPDHLKPIASFALYTGLRQSNVTKLQWKHVDLVKQTMWIDAPDMKGRKSLGLPLSDNAVTLLRSLFENRECDYIFLYNGKPITKIKLSWQKACIRAGLGVRLEDGTYDGFTFHGLRHTWASWKVQAGTPLMIVKELGGWSSLSMVERYAHLSPDHLKQYVNVGVA